MSSSFELLTIICCLSILLRFETIDSNKTSTIYPVVIGWVQLIVVAIVVILMWLCVRDFREMDKIVILLSTGLLISYIIAVLANLPPIIDIWLNENEALRTFPAHAYPFCIQQYRDYGAGLFSYALVIGWPEGIPVMQLALTDDQSEFIHMQHYFTGLILGIVLLVVVVILVSVLTVIDKKGLLANMKRSVSPHYIFIPLQIYLIFLLTSPLLFANFIYTIGGVFVLLVTLYPLLFKGQSNLPS